MNFIIKFKNYVITKSFKNLILKKSFLLFKIFN